MSSEFALLGLLLDGPKHGYELARRFSPETPLGDICHLEMSMLYALLKKQEKAGFIEPQIQSQGSRPPKRIFHLTNLGRAAFVDWVRSPVSLTYEIRQEFLVKLYFARQLGSDDVGALISRQVEVCRDQLEKLQESEVPESSNPRPNFTPENYSTAEFYEENSGPGLRGKRSHPRPNDSETSLENFPEEAQFFKLVNEMRIKQNQATIDWLLQIRRLLSGDYY